MKRILVIVVAALVCCSVVIINGAPVFHPDSISYLVDGQQLMRLTTPSSGRPIFYGLAIWFLHWERTTWLIVFVQGLIVTHLIWLALRVHGLASSATLLSVIIALTIMTPMSWYVSEVMPDIFTGILILSLLLLGFASDRLNVADIVYIVLLAAASAAFHLSNLPIALALPVTSGAVYWARMEWRPAMRPALMCVPIVLAVAGSLAFSLVEYRSFSFTTEKGPPWLMARLLADGTAKAYLRVTCPHERYVLCSKFAGLPNTPSDILWGPKRLAATVDERIQMHAEEGRIVLGTVLMFPGEVMGNIVAHTWEQLVTTGFSTEFTPTLGVQIMEEAPYTGRDYEHSLQRAGWWADSNLRLLNAFYATIGLLSLVVGIPLTMASLRHGEARPVLLGGIVVLGLLVNALITGSLSEVHGRYQGRAMWLLTFCTIVAGLVAARARVVARLPST